MFNDNDKTSFLVRFFFQLKTNLYYHLSFKKKINSLKGRPLIWGIWNVILYGPNINLGRGVIIVGANGYKTNLTVIKKGKTEGEINIGDNVLVMNGVRISSASKISIGHNCMLANFCYLTDADWHDLYDRSQTPGKTAPIHIKDGAWIGDSAIILKGVTVGENSVVGAGSVVSKDVPPNVVVAGNPARIIKQLDQKKIKVERKII